MGREMRNSKRVVRHKSHLLSTGTNELAQSNFDVCLNEAT